MTFKAHFFPLISPTQSSIISCKVVATCGFSIQKVNRQVERILSLIRDQRTKSRETREQLKSCETMELPYTCKYASGYLILNSVLVIYRLN